MKKILGLLVVVSCLGEMQGKELKNFFKNRTVCIPRASTKTAVSKNNFKRKVIREKRILSSRAEVITYMKKGIDPYAVTISPEVKSFLGDVDEEGVIDPAGTVLDHALKRWGEKHAWTQKLKKITARWGTRIRYSSEYPAEKNKELADLGERNQELRRQLWPLLTLEKDLEKVHLQQKALQNQLQGDATGRQELEQRLLDLSLQEKSMQDQLCVLNEQFKQQIMECEDIERRIQAQIADSQKASSKRE